MTSFSTLPIELVRQIFSYLKGGTAQVAFLSTCKALHAEFESLLYISITPQHVDSIYLLARTFLDKPELAVHVKHVNFREQVEISHRDPAGVLNATQIKKMKHTLSSLSSPRQHLQDRISEVYSNPAASPSVTSKFTSGFMYIMVLMQNLETINFEWRTCYNWALLDIFYRANTLQRIGDYNAPLSLRLATDIFVVNTWSDQSQVLQLRHLMKLPSLRTLTCRGFDTSGQSPDLDVNLDDTSQLTELYFTGCRVDVDTIDLYLWWHPHLKIFEYQYRNALPYLRLEPGCIFDAVYVLRHTLEQLTIADQSPQRSQENTTPPRPLATLGHFQKLASLTLSAYFLDYLFHDPKHPEIPPHVFRFSVLPPNMEDLTLSQIDDNAVALLRVLADRELVETLPQLVSIHLEFGQSVWMRYRQLENQCLGFCDEFRRLGITLTIDTEIATAYAERQLATSRLAIEFVDNDGSEFE